MFGLGMGELIVILIVFMLVFGASRLPELGRGLGQGMRGFRDALKGIDKPGSESEGKSESGSEVVGKDPTGHP